MGKFKLEDAVARYGRTLFAYAYSLLGDYHEAEDAVQEAFAAAHQSRERFDGANERAWLCRITYSKCMDCLRKRPAVSFEELDEGAVTAPSPDAGYTSDMADALGRLSAAERTVVLLRVVEGLNYGEMEERLGVAEAALRKRYERAKRRLAEYLTDAESEV